MQKLAVDVEDYMEDFWLKLEAREDVLTELLEQTQADNIQLQADLQIREDERNGLLDRLEQAGSTIRQSERDLADLKDEIADLEQIQADGLQQTARADSLHEECEKLKVDIAAKAAVARDLETRLQQSQSALLQETEEHKRHTGELHKLMEQREEAARATQGAAVEVARQEVTRDMDIAREKISALLKQAEAETVTLKDELNAARHRLSTAEETNRRDSTTADELRSELETAHAEAIRLNEEADENEVEFRKAFEYNSAHVEDLQAQVAFKEKAIAQLSEDAQSYDRQAQEVLDSLKTWTHGQQGAKGFASELEKAQSGNLDGIDPKLKPLLEIDLLHKAIFQSFHAQRNSEQNEEQGVAQESVATKDIWADLPPSSPPEQNPPKGIAARVLDQLRRRVTVKSPSQSMPSPTPLSVLAEQEHRRSANPPKSIMKTTNQSIILGDEDLAEPVMAAQSSSLPTRGVFGRRTYARSAVAKKAPEEDVESQEEHVREKSEFTRSIFTRPPYNRPVSGTNPRAENGAARHGSRVGREPQKRKQIDDQEAESPNKGTKTDQKKHKSMLSISHVSPPERQVGQADEFRVVPSAPRKRRKNTNVLGEATSHARSLHFPQSTSSAERDATIPGRTPNNGVRDVTLGGLKASLAPKAESSSQDGSQDPQSLFYRRRRSSQQNEDSHISVPRSQKMKIDSTGPPIRKRFTMG
ncbi:hypothetical protein Daus18300_006399 [Diaporthe australafricana]|uniref:Uncharacterized protein n=1 Tax=Diaporthe australafricana TaxID=127596 RepID=A0ABR3WUF0_9PEZI